MRLPAAIAIVLASGLLAACGSDSGSDSGEAGEASGAAAEQTTAPAPKPAKGAGGDAIASNLERGNEIVEGGQQALDAELAALDGAPVVVNRWASWCPPCRTELPFFNDSAQAHASDVAFLGINTLDDSREAAEGFLTEVPIAFPSVEDTDGEVARELGIGNVSPGTAFIDSRGEVVYTRQGAYSTREELEADIDSYLLSG